MYSGGFIGVALTSPFARTLQQAKAIHLEEMIAAFRSNVSTYGPQRSEMTQSVYPHQIFAVNLVHSIMQTSMAKDLLVYLEWKAIA